MLLLNRFRFFLLFILLSAFFSCSEEEPTDQSISATIFKRIESSDSGIDFNNKITPNLETKENLFDFDFFYNGAGVGVADINNDGLKDIFFCGNQVANKLYLNKGNFRFEDISATAGIDVGKRWSNGVTFVDINDDGWLDIYVAQGGPFAQENRKNLLYINQQDNTFQEKAAAYGLADSGLSTQSVFFDFDKDGDLDCVVSNENELYGVDPINFYRQLTSNANLRMKSSCHLYQNDNDTFKNITKEAGLLNPTFGLGLTVSDLNDDGWLDIYIANDYYVPDNMYINQKNGTFRDEAKTRLNQMSFFGMGVDVADVNNDGLQDIYVLDMASSDHYRAKTLMASMDVAGFDLLVNKLQMPHQYMFNSLQVNLGNDKYSNVAHFSHVAKTDWSWAGLLADFDHDGLKDILVTNGYRKYGLDNDLQAKVRAAQQEYKGRVPLEVKQLLYDAMPTEPLPNILYKNFGSLDFKDKTSDFGLDLPTYSNGAAICDLDNDGDLDLIINNMDSEALLYQNTVVENKLGNYLAIKLESGLSETFGKVTIKYGENVQMVESKRVRGYLSAVDDIVHFGLGNVTKIDTLRVKWASGKIEERYDVKANQLLTLKELGSKPLAQSGVSLSPKLFEQVGIGSLKLFFKHNENDYNDFEKEILLPYKQSSFGPCLVKGDVNGDSAIDLFVGGAAGQSSSVFIQTEDGFEKLPNNNFERDKQCEDINALFFDADGDNDNDLLVVSGGNAYPVDAEQYRNRLYINDGNGNFEKSQQRFSKFSGGAVAAIDYDQDGDLDLIEGNRIVPQRYPTPANSYIYSNENGQFSAVTEEVAKSFNEFGIVNDVLVTDFDQDGDDDFIAVGEWSHVGLFENQDGRFVDIAEQSGLNDIKGWFFSLHETDVNKDGLPDYLIGNVGMNTKFSASKEKPFKVYANDFDNNGSLDIVLSKKYKDEYVPVRGRECSSQQMPFIKDKFETFDEFAKASLTDIYGEGLANSVEFEANEFRSFVLLNKGNGVFDIEYLPNEAQLFPLLDAVIADFNQDGFKDAVLIGNIYNTEVETPRWDAGTGLVLYSNQKGGYLTSPTKKQEFFIDGNTKRLVQLEHKGLEKQYLIAGLNDELLKVFEMRQ